MAATKLWRPWVVQKQIKSEALLNILDLISIKREKDTCIVYDQRRMIKIYLVLKKNCSCTMDENHALIHNFSAPLTSKSTQVLVAMQISFLNAWYI